MMENVAGRKIVGSGNLLFGPRDYSGIVMVADLSFNLSIMPGLGDPRIQWQQLGPKLLEVTVSGDLTVVSRSAFFSLWNVGYLGGEPLHLYLSVQTSGNASGMSKHITYNFMVGLAGA